MKKLFITLIISLIICLAIPCVAHAADINLVDGQTYDLGEANPDDIVRVPTGAAVTLTGECDHVQVVCGAGVSVTLNNATINCLKPGYCALTFTGTGNKLYLAGTSKTTSGYNQPGVKVESAVELTIPANNTGSLTATAGKYGAGIGGSNNNNGGIIKIYSGAIKTISGFGGAGIGGGYKGEGESIKIYDGTVTAQAYPEGGAGLGGGDKANGGSIEIYGGAVTALGGQCNPGIGSGYESNGLANIKIYGGTVTATGEYGAAGIGGGYKCNGGTITIIGGTVTATGKIGYEDIGGAGIGGGSKGAGGTVTILGGTVTATGDAGGAGIGGGAEGVGGTVQIKGGTVKATGDAGGAGIGGGTIGNGGAITIEQGAVNATGGINGAGIGGGDGGAGGTITIKQGTVNATGGINGAGIGGGNAGAGGTIIIEQGAVTATGGINVAGIGGGNNAAGGVINISGGRVTSQRGDGAPLDIGYGLNSSGGTLGISGEAVVFLKNNECITPSTTHTRINYHPVTNGELYGVKTPSGWTMVSGYMFPCTISYNVNGATGTVPQSGTWNKGIKAPVAEIGDLKCGQLAFRNWNTSPDGTGIGYAPGSEFTIGDNNLLYATWVYQDVASITLLEHDISMRHHGTHVLVATLEESGTNKDKVVWYSSDSAVVTVDQNGVVSATGVGSATISAYVDGKSDTCTVTVKSKHVYSVTISGTSNTMSIGETMLLSADISPSNATNPNITWISNDSSVATVDTNGLVTAVGSGNAIIGAEIDGVTDTWDITVMHEVEKVTLNKSSIELAVGESIQLHGTIYPSNAGNGVITWESRDKNVATVDTSGKVMAVSEGATSIVLTVDGVSDACAIVVRSSNEQGESNSNKYEEKPEENITTEPKATSTPHNAQEETVVKINTVIINTSDLPEGTKYIMTPSGEIVPVDGDKVEVDLSGNEPMEIIALDDEKVPLGHFNVNISVQSTGSRVPVWVIVLGVLIGALVIGGVVFIIRKFGVRNS